MSEAKGRAFFFLGVFCITAATLMLQIIQTRILSVITWYHLAFLAISMAMFGLTAGAVWVYTRGERFSRRTVSHDLAHFSTAFALCIAVAFTVQMTLAPAAELTTMSVLVWIELALCLAAPFFFSGIAVSVALTKSPYRIGLVYGVDLLGAAVGCLGVLLLLDLTDGPSAVLWVSVLAMLGAFFFAASATDATPGETWALSNILKKRRVLLALLAAFAMASSLAPDAGLLRPVIVKGKLQSYGPDVLLEKWNSFSRILVTTMDEDSPQMWGASDRFYDHPWSVAQRLVSIDGDASTVAYGIGGDIDQAQFLKFDVSNMAYHLPGRDSAAIIGVGGGRDLMSAKVFGVSDITGVEINPILYDLLTTKPGFKEFTGLNDMDGVTLVVDEARNWFARSTEHFDVIQLSLIDTWAATGAGAFSLSENSLYTLEAWQNFVGHLSPKGIFTVSRWFIAENSSEVGRLTSLAMATLLNNGIKNPRDHLMLVSSGRIATLLVSRSSLVGEDLKTLQSVVDDLGFDVVYSPDVPAASAVLRGILDSSGHDQLHARSDAQFLDLTPPTDNRPFFFNQLRFSNAADLIALMVSGGSKGLSLSGNIYATSTLVILFIISLVLVVTTIEIPMRPAIKDVGRRLVVSGAVYFLCIGTGFMMIEIGMLQRLSVFLGHPIYSLSIVLFSLILLTGAGSLISEYAPLDCRRKLILWSLATAGYLFSLPLWLPEVLLTYESAQLLVRAGLCVAIIGPVGVLMGFAFPTGMRLISAVDARPTPWFWGINGAAGVLSSSAAVGLSIAFGINTTFMVGAVCYVLLIPAALAIGFKGAKLSN